MILYFIISKKRFLNSSLTNYWLIDNINYSRLPNISTEFDVDVEFDVEFEDKVELIILLFSFVIIFNVIIESSSWHQNSEEYWYEKQFKKE